MQPKPPQDAPCEPASQSSCGTSACREAAIPRLHQQSEVEPIDIVKPSALRCPCPVKSVRAPSHGAVGVAGRERDPTRAHPRQRESGARRQRMCLFGSLAIPPLLLHNLSRALVGRNGGEEWEIGASSDF